MQQEPKLTIIIPTLNRCETLKWAIKTVVAQQYDNLTIIVSDNCSDDDTYNVVHEYKDPRLQYVRTPQRFTMLQHFEYALNYVKEGRISFLGDDDGFLPQSLEKIKAIILKHDPPVIGWRFGNYNWPGLPVYYMVPLTNYYRIVKSKDEIKEVFASHFYQALRFPSLYGGFISIDLVNQLKQKYNGFFFHSRIPDFFSGAIIAANVESYIRLEFPITINATSAKSAGFSTVNRAADQKPFEGLSKDEGNIPFHPSLKFIRCNVVPIAEALIQVNALVPSFPKPDIKKVIREIIKELAVEEDEVKFAELNAGVLEIGRLNGLEDYVVDALSKMTRTPSKHVIRKKFSPISMVLYIDTTNTNINTVEDACNFAASIIPHRYYRLRNKLHKSYFRLTTFSWYLYLKFISDKKNIF